VLKLDVAFLYDLLGATQEHKIKPKKFAQTDIDEVIIGHTNEAEYKKLLNNEFMEALRDRTIKIDIPYITKFSEEIRIYEKDFNEERLRGKHVAPHTLEVAAMWAVLTRSRSPRSTTVAAPEDEALRRQDAAGLHAGQREGAAQGGQRARAWTASRRATCRTRSRTRS
jgi:predicted Ser/Thr protein kinase